MRYFEKVKVILENMDGLKLEIKKDEEAKEAFYRIWLLIETPEDIKFFEKEFDIKNKINYAYEFVTNNQKRQFNIYNIEQLINTTKWCRYANSDVLNKQQVKCDHGYCKDCPYKKRR